MSKLLETMQAKENYHGFVAATKEQIDEAQEKLGLTFASDYREYLSSAGVASFGGHELTGVCPSKRLDVVSVTKNNRKITCGINAAWYVLEELNIDQVTIWQDADSSIYCVAPHGKPVRIAKNIIEYINT